jgi:alpha-galactosidase
MYKKIRRTVQFGNLYRLRNFKEDKIYFNGYVSEDKSQAVYFSCTNANSTFGGNFVNVRFLGLDENAIYHMKSEWREATKSGAYFANVGIEFDYSKPLKAKFSYLKRLNKVVSVQWAVGSYWSLRSDL